MKSIYVAIFLLLLIQSAYGWFDVVHMIIAEFGVLYAGPEIEKMINEIISSEASQKLPLYSTHQGLMNAACWADSAKRLDPWKETAPMHGTSWKYIVGDCTPGYEDEAESIIRALYECLFKVMDNLKRPAEYRNETDLAINTRFLIHYLGDVHCPVHISTLYTTELCGLVGSHHAHYIPIHSPYEDVIPMARETYHYIWDRAGSIYRSLRVPLKNQEDVDYLKNVAKDLLHTCKDEDESIPFQFSPELWARETFDLSPEVYKGVTPNMTISKEKLLYIQKESVRLICKSGIRLGKTLKYAFESIDTTSTHGNMRSHSLDSKENLMLINNYKSSTTYILYVLCFGVAILIATILKPYIIQKSSKSL